MRGRGMQLPSQSQHPVCEDCSLPHAFFSGRCALRQTAATSSRLILCARCAQPQPPRSYFHFSHERRRPGPILIDMRRYITASGASSVVKEASKVAVVNSGDHNGRILARRIHLASPEDTEFKWRGIACLVRLKQGSMSVLRQKIIEVHEYIRIFVKRRRNS